MTDAALNNFAVPAPRKPTPKKHKSVTFGADEVDQSLEDKIKSLRATAATKDEYKHEPKPITAQDLDRFLSYECKYKRYKGKTWGWVLSNDFDYFTYIIKNVMEKSTRTYQVLSKLIDYQILK